MYEIYIYEEQENNVYNKLITYAMYKSDAFMNAKGLFNWKYPSYPDDLYFLKNGYCWFISKGDDEEAYIYVSTEEVKTLNKIGLKMLSCSDDWEYPDEKIKLFYEEY